MTATKSAKPKSDQARPKRKEQLTKLLSRKSGVSVKQLQHAFGWQPHTARAAMSRLRKTGALIERFDTKNGSVYRIRKQA